MSLRIVLLLFGGIIHSQALLTDELSGYDVIQPEQLHPSRSKRDLSTQNEDGHFPSTTLVLSSTKYGLLLRVDLQLNRDLFTSFYHEKHQTPSGAFIRSKNRVNHCYYHGSVSGLDNSTAAFSTCNGLRGIVYDGKDLYHIHPLDESKTSSANQKHILFHSDDVLQDPKKCGVLEDTDNFINDMLGSHSVMRRATNDAEFKHVSIVMVVDKRAYDKYGGDVAKATARAKEIANYMDWVYKRIRVRIALVMVEVWDIFDLIHVTTNPSETLGKFKQYNREVLSRQRDYSYDNMQLLTGVDFAGSVVGMAGVGTICTQASCGVNMDHSPSSSISANTVAHELGHNLGMGHDDDKCTCNNPPCVMSPSASSTRVNGFTDCSTAALDKKLASGVASCIFDVPPKLFGNPVCGNDYLEEGEECDCGNILECRQSGGDACCNATSCTLKSTAQCAVGPCCDECKFKTQGVLCRGNASECDLPEYCTGASPSCPANFFKQNGMDCANNLAYCFDGGCRTLKDQCETLWGEGADKGKEICFRRLNVDGDEWGHCGKDLRGNYIPCGAKDTLCGKLQCQSQRSFPIIGSGKKVRTFTFSTTPPSVCKAGVTSLGDDLDDPTVAQRGTKCDTDHICLNNTCVNITTVESITPCIGGCANDGICNNMGHCHCKVGFGCPACTVTGVGGSVDSGQGCPSSSGGSGMSGLTKGLLVVFLLIVPLLALLAFLVYRYHDRLPAAGRILKKRPKRRSFTQISERQSPPSVSPPAIVFRPTAPPSAPPSAGQRKAPPAVPHKPTDVESTSSHGNTYGPPPPYDGPSLPANLPSNPPVSYPTRAAPSAPSAPKPVPPKPINSVPPTPPKPAGSGNVKPSVAPKPAPVVGTTNTPPMLPVKPPPGRPQPPAPPRRV